MHRLLAALALAILLLAPTRSVGADVTLPAALEAWREWALHGHERRLCPAPDEDVARTRCRWPGELTLEADADGLSFAQTWTLQVRERVPLPGDARWRPLQVEVDGRAVAVALVGERPWLELDAGTHRVRGRIAWSQRPPALALPAEIALLALRIDGRPIERPERNADGELLLGSQGANEADALSAEVYRLLADGSPQWLATRVHFSVSGKPREETFAALLPEGFLPVALDSELPTRLEADGRLRTQLRAGQWNLTLIARADAPRTQFPLAPVQAPWPAQEIWQFRADPAFRTAQLEGVPGVDPQQVSIPAWDDGVQPDFGVRWSSMLFADAEELPAFLMQPGDTATLAIALRGLPSRRPPRLSLQRELWLDFDGDGFSAHDRIEGELGSAVRLDLHAPWSMQRAQRDGEVGLLITRGADAGATGVELRDADVDLEVDARVERDGIARASGWSQPFDEAQAVLNLPPGYRLIAAHGPDRASGSWWQAWNLLDLFLLCFGALLAWRAGGVRLLLPALLWFVLAWHQPLAPRVGVLMLLLFALLARHVRDGRAGFIVRVLRGAALAWVVLAGLGFALGELRLALHPQLEQAQVYGSRDAKFAYAPRARVAQEVEVTFSEAPAPAAASAPANRNNADASQELEQIVVSGTRLKRSDLYNYPIDAIVQSGQARPDWQWQRHDLAWNGPLLPDDELQLLLSPPWMTRLWRIAAVLLLVVVLWRVLRGARPAPAMRAAAAGAMSLIVLGLLPVGVRAQALPDTELRNELRDRLTTRAALCRPHCGGLGAVQVDATRARLRLTLEAQAQDDQIWPLPRPDASLTLIAVRIDGVAAAVVREPGGDVVALTRGVHRVEAEYAADGERWRIAFPLPPARIVLAAPGFEGIGLDEDRLIGDTLELVPPRASATDGGVDTSAASGEAVPPFVRVHRSLVLDQRWELRTRVVRVAPVNSGLNLRLPLWPGEQPFDNAPPIRDGEAVVSLPAGVAEIEWASRLEPSESYALAAGDGRSYAEEWTVWASPLLHVEFEGLPESGQDEYDGAQRFLPLPGERVDLRVTRPAAADGARLAFENVELALEPGQRARDATLSFDVRASAAGQHRIALPSGAELLEFSIDGDDQPLVLDPAGLRLPLRSGTQEIVIAWRDAVGVSTRLRSPDIDLGASASNLRTHLQLLQDRWLLATRGPLAGPAVLFWAELAAWALVAFVLARRGGAPLRFHQWLLLGLGFSTLSWFAAAVVALWLLAIAWRARRTDLVGRRVFPWLQIGLIVLSAAALLALLVAVPFGLLSQPDMHVVGNGSNAQLLRWFSDRSVDGALPAVEAITLPLWIYKLALLAWALWLANALIGWLRWAWHALGKGAWWSPIRHPKPAPPAAVAPVAPAP
jgi:hypothetical protein